MLSDDMLRTSCHFIVLTIKIYLQFWTDKEGKRISKNFGTVFKLWVVAALWLYININKFMFVSKIFLQNPQFQSMWYYLSVTQSLWREIIQTLRLNHHLEWRPQHSIMMSNTPLWTSTSTNLSENKTPRLLVKHFLLSSYLK